MNKNYFILFLIFFLTVSPTCKAQNSNKIKSITLMDGYEVNGYTDYWTTDIFDMWDVEKTSKYPPSNLFDANFKTCWVSNYRYKHRSDTLYFRLPNENELNFNIFSGYGKSKYLYFANSRPKTLQLTFFVAALYDFNSFQASGKYEALALQKKQYINLSDTFGLQSFIIPIHKKDLFLLQNKLINELKQNKNLKIPEYFNQKPEIIDTTVIVQVVISDTYKGNKYNDICISEMFFNNHYVSGNPKSAKINKVYTNKDENIILIDREDSTGIVVLQDPESVFIILEISKNKKWAFIGQLPAQVGPGRVEEINRIIDLSTKKFVKPEEYSFLGFDEDFLDTYAIFSDYRDNKEHKILLR